MNILCSCIGRRGYIAHWFKKELTSSNTIIGTSNSPWTPGFHACDIGVIMPDIHSDDYLVRLFEICRNQKVNAILSFFDPDIDVLSSHLKSFRDMEIVPIISDPKVSNICFDKFLTFEFLTEHGFNTPQTFIDLSKCLQSIKDGLIDYPLIVKERWGFASHNLFIARNKDELTVFYHYGSNMIIQQMLKGQEYSLDVLNDLLFTENDQIMVLEMNPRFGGGYPNSHLAGANFPAMILQMVRGESVQQTLGNYQSGIMMMKSYQILKGFSTHMIDLREKSINNLSM